MGNVGGHQKDEGREAKLRPSQHRAVTLSQGPVRTEPFFGNWCWHFPLRIPLRIPLLESTNQALVLASRQQSIAEHVIQLGDVINLFASFFDVIVDAVVLNGQRLSVQHHKTGAWILVARLANTAYINHDFGFGEIVFVVMILGRDKATSFRKDAWDVSMALKTILLESFHQVFQTRRFVYVFWKHIFVGWIPR